MKFFTCEECGAVLNLGGGEDFEEATAEHSCVANKWLLRGVKNADGYVLKGNIRELRRLNPEAFV